MGDFILRRKAMALLGRDDNGAWPELLTPQEISTLESPNDLAEAKAWLAEIEAAAKQGRLSIVENRIEPDGEPKPISHYGAYATLHPHISTHPQEPPEGWQAFLDGYPQGATFPRAWWNDGGRDNTKIRTVERYPCGKLMAFTLEIYLTLFHWKGTPFISRLDYRAWADRGHSKSDYVAAWIESVEVDCKAQGGNESDTALGRARREQLTAFTNNSKENSQARQEEWKRWRSEAERIQGTSQRKLSKSELARRVKKNLKLPDSIRTIRAHI